MDEEIESFDKIGKYNIFMQYSFSSHIYMDWKETLRQLHNLLEKYPE